MPCVAGAQVLRKNATGKPKTERALAQAKAAGTVETQKKGARMPAPPPPARPPLRARQNLRRSGYRRLIRLCLRVCAADAGNKHNVGGGGAVVSLRKLEADDGDYHRELPGPRR